MSDSKYPPVGTYLRHARTGDLGRVIEENGELFIKPDLPGSPVKYPITMYYNWMIEPRAKKLPPGSWAKVCYVADQALCDIHPELKRVPTEWASLHPLKRAEWIERKVKFKEPIRLELYNAITKILEESSA